MEEPSPSESRWPSSGVLVACALLLAAGYAFAVWRGPAPAQEVRVVTMPPPVPAPESAPTVE